MTTSPLPPRPIRRGEWVEVRCERCHRYLFDLRDTPGNEGRRHCPRCGRVHVAAIPERKVA